MKRTPYYEQQVALGARFVDRMGFAAPLEYSTTAQEHAAAREHVGLFDVYYQVAIEVKGREAEKLLLRALVNDVRRIPNGHALYASMLNEAGGMEDDLTCFRFSEVHFWLCPTPSRVKTVLEMLEREASGMSVSVTNLGYSNAYLSVQGPDSRQLLSELSEADLSCNGLPYFGNTRATVAGVPDVVVSRTGYSGELGYELFYPVEYAHHMWATINAMGAKYSLRPCGLGTLRSLRIEKKFVLYGLDVDSTTDPLSAGLGWTVRFDDRDFIGRRALERIKASGPNKILSLLQFAGFCPSVARGDSVHMRGREIGTVTSTEPAYSLGCTLAFAYLSKADAIEGNKVDVASKTAPTSDHIKASVLTKSPYDPERSRAKK